MHKDSAGVTYITPGKRIEKEDLCRPRSNTFVEQCVAVATQLLFFGYDFS